MPCKKASLLYNLLHHFTKGLSLMLAICRKCSQQITQIIPLVSSNANLKVSQVFQRASSTEKEPTSKYTKLISAQVEVGLYSNHVKFLKENKEFLEITDLSITQASNNLKAAREAHCKALLDYYGD